jgi:hypothetical protein
MTPMHVRCPECRASLHLLVQLLPARATCARCHSRFTLNSRPAITLPPEPAPAFIAPPTAAHPGLLPRLLHVFAVLVLLAVLLVSGIVIVNVCFSDDPPVPAVTPSQDPTSPATRHPISQGKRFRGN